MLRDVAVRVPIDIGVKLFFTASGALVIDVLPLEAAGMAVQENKRPAEGVALGEI